MSVFIIIVSNLEEDIVIFRFSKNSLRKLHFFIPILNFVTIQKTLTASRRRAKNLQIFHILKSNIFNVEGEN